MRQTQCKTCKGLGVVLFEIVPEGQKGRVVMNGVIREEIGPVRRVSACLRCDGQGVVDEIDACPRVSFKDGLVMIHG